jgi:hypothetical protein
MEIWWHLGIWWANLIRTLNLGTRPENFELLVRQLSGVPLKLGPVPLYFGPLDRSLTYFCRTLRNRVSNMPYREISSYWTEVPGICPYVHTESCMSKFMTYLKLHWTLSWIFVNGVPLIIGPEPRVLSSTSPYFDLLLPNTAKSCEKHAWSWKFEFSDWISRYLPIRAHCIDCITIYYVFQVELNP